MEVDWGTILRQIKDEKCILFIGPNSVLKEPGVLYHQELLNSPVFSKNEEYKYIERDEMFLLFKKSKKGKLVSDFLSYCDMNKYYEDIYVKLAKIPFHAIVIATRYPFLKDVFDKEFIPYQFAWFSKIPVIEQKKNDFRLSKKKPLIYNLFGNFKNDESLLLTHSDLFDYLKRILVEGPPDYLASAVRSSRQIIFLGFNFERWYVQLLMRIFNLNSSDAEFERLSTSYESEEDIMKICTTDFNINFISHNIDSFVNDLYEKCQDDNILRKPTNENNLKNMLKELLEENEFDQVFDKLKNLTKNKSDLENTVSLLVSDYNNAAEDYYKINKKEIDFNDERIRQTRISILSLIDEIFNN
ncbi:MAG TPA: SIR2 family protein [Bacteroidia bacterium]|nr:SIR2 family protein [Bacteroidia bacterium]